MADRFRTALAGVIAFALLLAALAPAPANAQTLAASEYRAGLGYGYGEHRIDNFSGVLDAHFDSVSIIRDLSSYLELIQYDALLVQNRDITDQLSALEATNLAKYIATGRRVLLIGSNNDWRRWNNSILSVVGGSHDDEYSGLATLLNPHPPLTNNVDVIEMTRGGFAQGGLSLFSINTATVWDGDGSQNVLSLLDLNVIDDARWYRQDNRHFAVGIAEWLSTGPRRGPTLSIFGLCPGRKTATVTRATPGGRVALFFAQAPGSIMIPDGNPCAGTLTGLNGTAILVQIGTADASGEVVFTGDAPAGACDGVMQALDLESCQVTNVDNL
ncbi:MAG: hypothetical protein ACF8PN_08750 [Phycisphaerales bacterium]